MTERILTTRDARYLGQILDWCDRGARVNFIPLGTDEVRQGEVRHLVKSAESLGFLGPDDDVRDAVLRITSGTEFFINVTDAMYMIANGHIGEDR